MYILKKHPEDFIVKEIPKQSFGNGSYVICLLKKKNYTTHLAIQIIAKALGTSDIGYAGNKDLRAVTEQYISVGGVSESKIAEFSHPDISLNIVGKGNRISVGDLVGNNFEIIVRNAPSAPTSRKYFVNYFGEQRFSSDNIAVGRAIVKKDFKTAVAYISSSNEKRTALEDHIAKKPQDYVGALQTLPPTILSLYIHAYQSYLWNKSVSRFITSTGGTGSVKISGMTFALSDTFSDAVFPLPGFETEEVPPILDALLKEEGIALRDFVIPQLKSISAGGAFRPVFAEATDISCAEIQGDNESEGKTFLITFSLPKGSYATVYIAQLFE